MDGVYQEFKGMKYRMSEEKLAGTFKLAGIPAKGHNFQNIGAYHSNFRSLMKEKNSPYMEVGYLGSAPDGYDYFFGCAVESLEDLPEGLTGIDTGVDRFAVITFRAGSAEELVGGDDGPGNAMKIAAEYIREIWLPANEHLVDCIDKKHLRFRIGAGDMHLLEVYKSDIQENPEMCFYIPLKS